MIYRSSRIGKVDPTRERLYLIETKIAITMVRRDQASATSATTSVARFKTADIATKSKARYLAVCRHGYSHLLMGCHNLNANSNDG